MNFVEHHLILSPESKNILSLAGVLMIMLIWPNSFPADLGDIGKRIATFTMILFCLFLVIRYSKQIQYIPNDITIVTTLLFGYLLSRNAYYFMFEEPIFRDFAEITRILGMGIFFLLGQTYSKRINETINMPLLNLVTLVFVVIVALWFFVGESSIPVYDMYITRGGRFSGVMASVNYVWAPTVILATMILWFNFKTENLRSKTGQFTVYLLLALLLLQLIFSGSRTSVIAVISAILVASVLNFSTLRSMRALVWVLLGSSFVYLAGPFIYGALLRYESNIQRIIELFGILMSLELSNLLEVPTLSKRFLMWDAAWTDISNRLIIGHGSNKTGLTILDNSYLMSIYRYGVIGLFLELSLYALIIRNCIRDNSSDWVAGLTLIFLSAFLVAGTTATVFYELKLPYIFMLLAGALSARPLGGGGLECVD